MKIVGLRQRPVLVHLLPVVGWLGVACTEGNGSDGDTHDSDTPADDPALVLSPVGVIDEDYPTIVHVTWSTPEAVTGWVEFGLDGAFDKKSPAVAASEHVHQLRGMKAGRSYSWRAVVDVDGELVTSNEQIVDLPPPPADLPTFDLVTLEPTATVANAYISVAGAAAPGRGWDDPEALYYMGILDAEGDFVWYHLLPYGRGTSALDISLDQSSVWWMEIDNFRNEVDSTIVRMTLDGTILSQTLAVTGHHAAVEMPGGRFAHLGRAFRDGEGDKTLMTDRVMIATEGDGTGAQSVELWDYYTDWWESDISYFWLAAGEGSGAMWGYSNVVDLTHSNSIGWVESQDALYPFVRVMDTLLRIDVPSATLDWQMSGLYSDFTFPGGEPLYESATNSYLWSRGHYSQIWPGGLTMFDNGSNYTPPVSSILEVAFDEATKTAYEVFRYTDPAGGHTASLGDVWRLESGNYVASWMSLSKLTEVTPAGELVWRLDPPEDTATRRIRVISDLYTFRSLAAPPPEGGTPPPP